MLQAGEQLCLATQTLSGQTKLLEGCVGRKLLHRVGRNLELIGHQRLARGNAGQMFTPGGEGASNLRGNRITQRQIVPQAQKRKDSMRARCAISDRRATGHIRSGTSS